MFQRDECNTYVQHLRVEHRHLEQELRRIWKLLLRPDANQLTAAEMLEGLGGLSVELRRHFAAEEEGGCLEEAVSRCPTVAARVDELQQQHATLLNSLEQLTARLRAAAPRAPVDGFSRELSRFSQSLSAHEAAENQVMRQAFGVTVNGEEE